MSTIETQGLLFMEFLAACWKSCGQIFLFMIVPATFLTIGIIESQRKTVREIPENG